MNSIYPGSSLPPTRWAVSSKAVGDGTPLPGNMALGATRLPYDLAAFPQASICVCTYGILEPFMRAAAKAIFGFGEMTGRLPVSIPGLV